MIEMWDVHKQMGGITSELTPKCAGVTDDHFNGLNQNLLERLLAQVSDMPDGEMNDK